LKEDVANDEACNIPVRHVCAKVRARYVSVPGVSFAPVHRSICWYEVCPEAILSQNF